MNCARKKFSFYFSTPEPRKRLNNLVSNLDEKNLDNLYSQFWAPICSLFEDRQDAITIDDLLESSHGN